MNREFDADVASAMYEIVYANIGKFINESICDMIHYSDMSDIMKLSVIDGAIALGVWQSTPQELAQLREWRAEFVENMDD